MVFANKDCFIYSFPVFTHFIDFSFLITLARTVRKMLNKNIHRKNPYLLISYYSLFFTMYLKNAEKNTCDLGFLKSLLDSIFVILCGRHHRKLIKLITWITALSNSMKLWAILCRATQDGQVMVESSDKMWSTGEGNGKPLQYSHLENPINSMKRQKDRKLNNEFPRNSPGP